ncbi:MAG: hypothetical protein ACI8ZB_003406 [Desulforhopalus sp.]|jgi:hypothetical protein
MFIEYDDQERVKVINELDWLGVLCNVRFINDNVYFCKILDLFRSKSLTFQL